MKRESRTGSIITKIRTTSMIVLAVTVPLTLFNILMTSVGLTQLHEPLDYGLAVFFAVVSVFGIVLILLQIKRLRLPGLFYSYGPRITRGDNTVQALSLTTGHPPQKVVKNIHALIKAGLLPGCYYDAVLGQVIVPGTDAAKGAAGVVYTALRCPNCGAMNKLAPGSAKCEYCGTKLNINSK